MKKQVDNIDATPPKEIFRSIIADYDILLGICELIDNAIDIWTKGGANKSLNIKVLLDEQQQKITITDNAGGIKKEDIVLFISPGRTGNTATEESIGIFGVGSKRAVVALAQNIPRWCATPVAFHNITPPQIKVVSKLLKHKSILNNAINFISLKPDYIFNINELNRDILR